MKTIGLLGGMSWESTALYYAIINEAVRQRLGGLHSAPICLVSVDFAEIERYQHQGEWDKAAEVLTLAAKSVERGGGECLVICTNTMHKLADSVRAGIGIPLLHIADVTGRQLQSDGIRRVALLGTRFTMEEPFYRETLENDWNLQVLTPDTHGREAMHRIIYDELCIGKVDPASRQIVLGIVDTLKAEGAEGVVLGCTEIAMLVKAGDTDIMLYDTTRLHAEAAVDWALAP